MLHALIAALLVAQVTPPPPPPILAAPTASSSPNPSSSPPAGVAPSPAPAQLIVNPTNVNINPAQQALVTVTNATGLLQATLLHKLVMLSIDQQTHVITITATQATGTDTLHVVDAAGAVADIPIRVLFNAGTIPPAAQLSVTGSPVDPVWLAQQVQALVRRLALVAPGAQATIAPVQAAPSPLPPGAQSTFVVPVQIAGNGLYLDMNGTTAVTVQNVPLDGFSPPLLFYDDDPERITQDGVLYRGTITMAKPARLYYYHDDGSDPRQLAVVLTSASQDPTQVQVIDSSAGPNIDVMSVGHEVAKEFLVLKPHNEGVIVNLGANAYALHDLAMTYEQGAAGSVDFRILSGGPITVSVVAVSPGVDPRTVLDQPRVPGDGHHRTGVFALDGFGTDRLSYTAGGSAASVVYADRTSSPQNVDPASDGHDYGDYGVLRTIVIDLANPTDTPAIAYLYEKPIGGVVRSSFLVDGAIVQVGCVREPVPYQISAFALAPQSKYRAVVQTMTDGGSNYPIEVGVTAIPPQPAAPPISAPDGCFPKPNAPVPAPAAGSAPPPAMPGPASSPSPAPAVTPGAVASPGGF